MTIPSHILSFSKTPARKNILFWGFVFMVLVTWFFIRVQDATHSDMLWLATAMGRLLDGYRMVDAAYETNPPLSILLYALPVLSQRWLDIPLHYTIFMQSMIILAGFIFAFVRLVRSFDGLDASEQNILIFTYLLANTICAAFQFGERDQLIAMVLPPFVLGQLRLMSPAGKTEGWLWGLFIVGGAILLLKPMHGLLPTLLILYRLARTQKLSTLLQPDVISLAGVTLAYTTIILIYFQDYMRIILPNVWAFYIPAGGVDKTLAYIAETGIASVIIMVTLSQQTMNNRVRNLILLFLACASIALISMIIQGKGFYYHFLPTLNFLMAAGLLVFYRLLYTETPRWAFVMSLVISLGAVLIACPLNRQYPTHDNFVNTSLPAFLKTCKDSGVCHSFFMFNQDMGLYHESAYYTGLPHASRFPALWFAPAILDNPKAIQYFGRLVAEDLEHYKPELLFIAQPDSFDPPLDLIKLLAPSRDFKKAFSHYTYDRDITFDYRDHYKGVASQLPSPRFRIYQRR